MFSEKRFFVLVLVLCLVGLVGPATAAKPGKVQKPITARFDLQMKIWQYTRSTYDRKRRDQCSGALFRARGAGEQTMRVRIPRTRVTVKRIPEWVLGHPVYRMWPVGYRPDFMAPYRVRVAADRRANHHVNELEPPRRDCAEGGPDAREPDPDCGPRSVHGRLDLLPPFMGASRGLGIRLGGPYRPGGFEDLIDSVYEQCALDGPQGLINPKKRPVIAAAKLFGKRKKILASGAERRVRQVSGGRITTTMKWNLVLTRRKK